MARSMIVVRTRYRGNRCNKNKEKAIAAYTLSKDKNAPIRLGLKKAKKHRGSKKKRNGALTAKDQADCRRTIGATEGASSSAFGSVPFGQNRTAAGDACAGRAIGMGVRAELEHECSHEEVAETLRLLRRADKPAVGNRPATKALIAKLVMLGLPADIISQCSYREAVLTLQTLQTRRCEEPASESQIRRMLKLEIRLNDACGCSFAEADETLQALESRTPPKTKRGTSPPRQDDVGKIVAMAERLPVAELAALVRTLQRSLDRKK